jgi:DNA polymerase-3 subunit epsilon/ATP-dependent DNA helicase DinG
MVLFTSNTQLRQTVQAITARLALGDIAIYAQNESSSRQALLEGFKATERAVLLGTRSFWEGVDIPGDSLSALVIVRLPFAVPSDPIFAARSDSYAEAFHQYALPDAVLRFRQGFGRLIRSSADRGVVAIFDSRILKKRYGTQFMEALPECTVQRGALNKLADAAKNWLQREK